MEIIDIKTVPTKDLTAKTVFRTTEGSVDAPLITIQIYTVRSNKKQVSMRSW